MGTIVLILVRGGVFYFVMLFTVSFGAGGEDAAMGKAIASFMFTVALWIVLALLVGTAAIMGEMPRRIVIISALLVPLAGVTTFVAIDACSRHMKWAVIGPVLLPLLIASWRSWRASQNFALHCR